MAPRNGHRRNPAIAEAATSSMLSEHQIADELEEVDDGPEEEIHPFGSGLDPEMRSDPRELAGNDWNSYYLVLCQ